MCLRRRSTVIDAQIMSGRLSVALKLGLNPVQVNSVNEAT